MHQIKTFRRAAVLLLLLVVLIAGCSTGRRSPDQRSRQGSQANAAMFHSFAVPLPVMRIGLIDRAESRLTVTARKGLRLLTASARPAYDGRLKSINFFIKGYQGGKPSTVYRVQAGSFSKLSNARTLAEKLAAQYRLAFVTPYNSQTRTYRVQIGAFSTRDEAGSLQARMRGDGLGDTLIVTEKQPVRHSGRLNVINIDGSFLTSAKAFIVIPAVASDYLRVNDAPFRGALEIRIGEDGTVLPINIVNLEDYLRGVVPAEMSSAVYPQLEALKAQALAARTYAVKNRGQYADKGFDICNTAACQVYKGVAIEQEMTDRAIAQTSGEVITYKGEPINALFSSTSGGHTEHAENIFGGEPVPYLRGVPSRPGSDHVRYVSTVGKAKAVNGRDGSPLNYYRDVLGHYGFNFNRFEPARAVDPEDLKRVLQRLAPAFQGEVKLIHPENPRRIDLLNMLAAALAWSELVEKSVSELDIAVVFPGADSGLTTYEKKLALYFLRFGLIKPVIGGSLMLQGAATVEDAVRILYEILVYHDVVEMHRGNLVNRDDSLFHLEEGRLVHSYKLARDVSLYQDIDGVLVPVQAIRPVSGDMLRALQKNGTITLLVHEPSTQGLTNDRFSRFHHWDVNYSMRELSSRVAEYVQIGDVVDLKPLQYGVSRRIIELEIVGTAGNAVFKGLRIRWVLGVRDTLFTILKVSGPDGKQKGWRFVGSGWGHGVGLCQVGSYGMALGGADYRQIVNHFYTGVEIEKVSP